MFYTSVNRIIYITSILVSKKALVHAHADFAPLVTKIKTCQNLVCPCYKTKVI